MNRNLKLLLKALIRLVYFKTDFFLCGGFVCLLLLWLLYSFLHCMTVKCPVILWHLDLTISFEEPRGLAVGEGRLGLGNKLKFMQSICIACFLSQTKHCKVSQGYRLSRNTIALILEERRVFY